jgi:general secretion pathway protein J
VTPASSAPAAAPAGRRRRAGFTLIELLVALSILALLSLLGYRAVVSLTDAEVRLTAETAQWRALDAFFMRLEADLRQAQPRAVRSAGGAEPAWVLVPDLDGNAEVRFSRAGPEMALEAGSAGQRIGYRLHEGTIEVLYWPYLDAAPGTAPTAYALVEGVRGLAISGLDSTGSWRDRWPVTGEAALPRAVRLELTLAGGEVVERWLVLR